MPQKNKTRLNFNPKKQIPNRVERTNVGSKAPNVVIRMNNGSEIENTITDDNPVVVEVPLPRNEYGVPYYNTTIRMHREMNALQNMRLTITNEPNPEANIAPNVTKKMNFAPNVAVFKDLPSINVNDSLFEVPQPKASMSKTKQKNAENQPKEPELSEYLEKIEEFGVPVPEPELEMDFSPQHFDFLAAYRKIYGYN